MSLSFHGFVFLCMIRIIKNLKMALSIEVFLYPTPSPYLVAFPLSFASFLYWKNGLERSIVVDINKPTRIHIENSGYENWDSKQSQQQDFFSGFSYLVLPLLHMFFYDFRLGDKILKSSSTNKTITFKSYHFFFFCTNQNFHYPDAKTNM